MLISSKNRWALMHENMNNNELTLIDLINLLGKIKYDLILVEGFKAESFPKIELYRKEVSKDRGLLSSSDKNVVAIATEQKTKLETSLPVLDINNPQNIVDFIINFLNIKK